MRQAGAMEAGPLEGGARVGSDRRLDLGPRRASAREPSQIRLGGETGRVPGVSATKLNFIVQEVRSDFLGSSEARGRRD